MRTVLRAAQAVGLWLALTAAAFADGPLKIATSAGPVGQLAAFAAKLAKEKGQDVKIVELSDWVCLLYTSPSPRDRTRSRMPSSA